MGAYGRLCYLVAVGNKPFATMTQETVMRRYEAGLSADVKWPRRMSRLSFALRTVARGCTSEEAARRWDAQRVEHYFKSHFRLAFETWGAESLPQRQTQGRAPP